jgi:DNA-directed RNA polymerase specialized sigma24 family protein
MPQLPRHGPSPDDDRDHPWPAGEGLDPSTDAQELDEPLSVPEALLEAVEADLRVPGHRAVDPEHAAIQQDQIRRGLAPLPEAVQRALVYEAAGYSRRLAADIVGSTPDAIHSRVDRERTKRKDPTSRPPLSDEHDTEGGRAL